MNKRFAFLLATAAIAGAAQFTPGAHAADKIRLGFISTVSGPIAVLGREQEMGLELALKVLGGKIGGLPVEVFKEDARMTPDTALQAATKLVEKDKIDFLIGNMLSNAVLAYTKPVTDSGAFILSGIAGPRELAGASCNPNFFVISWQNDTPSEAVGKYMRDQGMKRVSVISQNYVTGKEHAQGAMHYARTEVVSEAYVPIPQVDYAAEIAQIRAARPGAVFTFLPGAGGIAFIKQFQGAGLLKDIRVFSGSWIADEHSFAALGDAALGIEVGANWFVGLDNPANKKFVEEFRQQHRRNPVFYAAFVYDSVMLLDAVVKAVGGRIENKDAVRAELRKANFQSTRGKFKFNNNHVPIQDFYIAKVVRKNNVTQHEIIATAFKDHKDRYHQDCKMTW